MKTEPSEDFTQQKGVSCCHRGVFAYVQNCCLRGVPLDIFSVPQEANIETRTREYLAFGTSSCFAGKARRHFLPVAKARGLRAARNGEYFMSTVAEAMERLLHVMSKLEMPAAGNLLPGLTPTEILSLTHGLNLPLVSELIELYELRNGVLSAGRYPKDITIYYGYWMLPLQDAVTTPRG